MNAMPADSKDRSAAPPGAERRDGFVALDACHKEMLKACAKLEDLVATIDRSGVTPLEQAAAAAIAEFYTATARPHHEDEERHVFPPLLASPDAALVHVVQRLQQDHGWLEEDWMELEPHVQSIATGYGYCDMDVLRQGVEISSRSRSRSPIRRRVPASVRRHGERWGARWRPVAAPRGPPRRADPARPGPARPRSRPG